MGGLICVLRRTRRRKLKRSGRQGRAGLSGKLLALSPARPAAGQAPHSRRMAADDRKDDRVRLPDWQFEDCADGRSRLPGPDPRSCGNASSGLGQSPRCRRAVTRAGRVALNGRPDGARSRGDQHSLTRRHSRYEHAHLVPDFPGLAAATGPDSPMGIPQSRPSNESLEGERL